VGQGAAFGGDADAGGLAYHSSVHSNRLPIMSSAPHVLRHPDPSPVFRGAVFVVAVWHPAPSGVPLPAASHSLPVGKRLPLARHASFA
jgi:hypothetical protein